MTIIYGVDFAADGFDCIGDAWQAFGLTKSTTLAKMGLIFT